MPEGDKACDTLLEYRDIYYGAAITGTAPPPPFDLDGCGSK